jgi:hypothetical protein
MEWRTRSRKGRVAAGPRVPRRERRLPRHLRRASISNAAAHARRPQTPTMCHDRRATSELGQQGMRTPTAGRPCIMTGTGRSGGTLSPGRPGLCPCQPEAECARGPGRKGRALRSRAAGPAGQSASSAPLHFPGRCGVSPAEGVTGDETTAPAQGKAFPTRNMLHRFRGMEIAVPVQAAPAMRCFPPRSIDPGIQNGDMRMATWRPCIPDVLRSGKSPGKSAPWTRDRVTGEYLTGGADDRTGAGVPLARLFCQYGRGKDAVHFSGQDPCHCAAGL